MQPRRMGTAPHYLYFVWFWLASQCALLAGFDSVIVVGHYWVSDWCAWVGVSVVRSCVATDWRFVMGCVPMRRLQACGQGQDGSYEEAHNGVSARGLQTT